MFRDFLPFIIFLILITVAAWLILSAFVKSF